MKQKIMKYEDVKELFSTAVAIAAKSHVIANDTHDKMLFKASIGNYENYAHRAEVLGEVLLMSKIDVWRLLADAERDYKRTR